ELSRYYDEAITRDIAFIKLVILPSLQRHARALPKAAIDSNIEELAKKNEELKNLEELRDVFDKVITPVAKCMLSAIDKGFDLEAARTAVRALVDVIVQILLRADSR